MRRKTVELGQEVLHYNRKKHKKITYPKHLTMKHITPKYEDWIHFKGSSEIVVNYFVE